MSIMMMKLTRKRAWHCTASIRRAYSGNRGSFMTIPIRRIGGVAPFIGRMTARRQSCLVADQREYMTWKLYGKPTFSVDTSAGVLRKTGFGTGARIKCWLRKFSHGGRIWEFLVKASTTGVSIEAKVPCLPINWVRHKPLVRATRAFVTDLVSRLPPPRLM
jgi:hypothetical protein